MNVDDVLVTMAFHDISRISGDGEYADKLFGATVITAKKRRRA